MSEYAVGVFLISAIVGMLSHLSYGGKSDISKLALSVLMLYVVVAPLADMVKNTDFKSLFEVGYNEEIITDGYEVVAEDAFIKGIESAVAEKFSLSKDNIRVRVVDFDFENMRAEKIRVTLSGRAALADYKAIEKYLDGLNIGECRCEIEIG